MSEDLDFKKFPTSDEPVPPSAQAETNEVLEEILLSLKAERVLIFLKVEGTWRIANAHEVDTRDFWVLAPVSLGIIHMAMKGETVLLMDAYSSGLGLRNSVILTGVRSVVCASHKSNSGEVSVVLYADNRITKGAFSEEDRSVLQNLADELGRKIF